MIAHRALAVLALASVVNAANFFLNLYLMEQQQCQFGLPQSEVATVSIQPDVCKHVFLNSFSISKYVILKSDAGRTGTYAYGDFCDEKCNDCEYWPEGMYEDNDCIETLDGSAAIHSKFCPGSTNLDTEADSIAVFAYSGGNCNEVTNDDILMIRVYAKQSTAGCTPDYRAGNNFTHYYKLGVTQDRGATFYSGAFQCVDSDCSRCEYSFTSTPLQEDSCTVTDTGRAIKITDAGSGLEACNVDPDQPTPPPTYRPGPQPATTPGPDFGDQESNPALIGAIVGGGVGLALMVFGLALVYRRYEYRQRQVLNVHYTTATKNQNYGSTATAASFEDEGMTTDI